MTKHVSDNNMRRKRNTWIKSLRNQGILSKKTLTKSQAKDVIINTAKEMSLLDDLKKKSKLSKALNQIRHELLRRTDAITIAFYGHSAQNKFRFFSNFFKTDIVLTDEELLRIIGASLPHLDIEELTIEGNIWTFHSSEQLFMFLKAMCMRDEKQAVAIYDSNTPNKAKKMGREISPYEPDLWEGCGFSCMMQALLVKFQQHREAGRLLISTGEDILVEAAPSDKKWGVGINMEMVRAGKCWKGDNLLGEALMLVRERLNNK